MHKNIILIGIDGLGVFFQNSNVAPFLSKFFENGSIKYVNSVIPTDSADNWGSMFTGVLPHKHKFKYEKLQGPYNCEFQSIFKIISIKCPNCKIAAFASWEKIITGMIESELEMTKYAPKLNENLLSNFIMYFNHYWFNNPTYDYYVLQNLKLYLKKQNNESNFLFIHLVDLDEAGHIHGFKSKKYFEQLSQTDQYIKIIIEEINKYIDSPLIIITTDHGGVEKSHGGDSEDEKNVFIGTNCDLKNFSININSNMTCAEIVLKNFGIEIPNYFDHVDSRFMSQGTSSLGFPLILDNICMI